MGRYVLLKAAFELLHILNLERETGGIGVTAKVLKQVLATLNGLVYVKSRYRTGRSGCQVAGLGQNHCRLVEDLGQT